jgi:hypothetical protein
LFADALYTFTGSDAGLWQGSADTNGNLWWGGNGQPVRKYTTTGSLLLSAGSNSRFTTVTSTGMVVIAGFDATSASLFNLDGTAKSTPSFALGCTTRAGFGIDDSNVIYVLCTSNVVRKFTDGVPPVFSGPAITLVGQTVSQFGFTVCPSGDMWATSDAASRVVRKYNPDGSYTGITYTFADSGQPAPMLTCDKNNNLWGRNYQSGPKQISPQGVLLQSLPDIGGGYGLIITGGPLPSQRNPFGGLYADDDSVSPDSATLFTGTSCAPTQNPTNNPV